MAASAEKSIGYGMGKRVLSAVSRGAGKMVGWAYYAPLCRGGGRAAGRRLGEKKMQTWTFAFFSTSQPIAPEMGCASPFEPLMKGL